MKRLIPFVLAAVACAENTAAFQPTENVTDSAPGGQPAASYDIRRDAESEPHARVQVWTRGAYVDDGRTFARVAVELRNLGRQYISIDPKQLRLDAYSDEGGTFPPARLVLVEGRQLAAAPGTATTVELVYALPRGIEPDDIGSMRLRWAVQHEGGQRYVQFTDFRRTPELYTTGLTYYDPIYGYYDPFLYNRPFAYHYTYRAPVDRVIISRRDR